MRMLPRLTVRAKIMGTIIAVSVMVLVLAAMAGWNALTSKGRGRYLEKHVERFELNLREVADARQTATAVLARDPGLAAALQAGAADQVNAAVKRLVVPLQTHQAPDLLVVSDAAGGVYEVPGLASLSTYRSSRIFQELRAGKSIHGAYAVLDGVGYMGTGVPIRSESGVVGTVFIAYRLTPYFKLFSANSDKAHPYIPVVVDNGQVVASALPASEHGAFVESLNDPITVKETYKGNEVDIEYLELNLDPESKSYDFARTDFKGFNLNSGPDAKIGNLYLVRSRDHIQESQWERVGVLAIYLGIAFTLALIIGYALAFQITSPLKRYIEATNALVRGDADLTTRLDVRTKDELGVLAHNLNRVFEKIGSLAGDVQRSAFQVGASSGEISTVSQQMLDGAKEQAGKISNSTAAVTELSSSIQQVAENAANASRTAKQSGQAVTDAIARLDQIRATVEDAASRIGALGESGKRIGNIVEVIRQISEQTTMLALNAAIEAAHAGEHGRGFAVVADEVSSLAKRVGQSAKDIEDLIATIHDQTGEAVRVMQDGSKEVKHGTGLVTSTLGDLQTLIDVIDDTASAVQEQAIASDEIARNMDAVQRIAEQVLASSENAVAQGEKLHALADKLEESVGGFKLDTDALPAAATPHMLPRGGDSS